MDVTKPYKFTWFGDVHGPNPHEFTGFDAMDATKPYKIIRFDDIHGSFSTSEDPSTQKIVRFKRNAGYLVYCTGRTWKGPRGGLWAEAGSALR